MLALTITCIGDIINNVVNQVAFLRTSRQFPTEPKELTIEIDKAYVDTANAVNNRIISIFPTNRPARDGENWFFNNQRQEGLRRVYTFTSNADIPLGFKLNRISQPTRCWGQYTDGTHYYGVIWGTSVAVAGLLTFYIFVDTTSTTTDLIRFVGAGFPAITNGFVVIEWISQV